MSLQCNLEPRLCFIAPSLGHHRALWCHHISLRGHHCVLLNNCSAISCHHNVLCVITISYFTITVSYPNVHHSVLLGYYMSYCLTAVSYGVISVSFCFHRFLFFHQLHILSLLWPIILSLFSILFHSVILCYHCVLLALLCH